MDIGLIGAANSHARQFAQAINGGAQAGHPRHRVTHVYGGDDPQAAQKLCGDFGLALCATEDELVQRCGAVVITYRRGSQHYPAVMKALRAGRPVFNDKPFTTDTAQAQEIIGYAEANGLLLCGGSGLKDMPALDAVKQKIGPGSVVTLSFSADPASPYDGYWFYGMHSAEVCQQLCGQDWQGVQALRSGPLVVAAVDYADRQCVLTTHPGLESLHITVANGAQADFFTIPLEFARLGPDAFTAMLDSGTPPRPYAFYRQAVALVQGIVQTAGL